MPSADTIRKELARAGAVRKRARGELEKADDDLAKWFRHARDHPDVPMTEAVEIADAEVERSAAYKLVRERT